MAEASSSSSLKLVVVTPERRVLETPCDWVSIPAYSGYVTILPKHTPLISLSAIDELVYQNGTKTAKLALAGGVFEIFENVITVLADSAEAPEEIDAEAAKKRLKEGQAAMEGAAGEDVATARRQIQHAETRLKVARES